MNPTYHPTLETKRSILTQKRDQFRAMGYEAEVEVETIAVQVAGTDEDAAQTIANLKSKASNCYMSARRLDEMLAKLPQPKPDKK